MLMLQAVGRSAAPTSSGCLHLDPGTLVTSLYLDIVCFSPTLNDL